MSGREGINDLKDFKDFKVLRDTDAILRVRDWLSPIPAARRGGTFAQTTSVTERTFCVERRVSNLQAVRHTPFNAKRQHLAILPSFVRVEEGIRTLDLRNHNPSL